GSDHPRGGGRASATQAQRDADGELRLHIKVFLLDLFQQRDTPADRQAQEVAHPLMAQLAADPQALVMLFATQVAHHGAGKEATGHGGATVDAVAQAGHPAEVVFQALIAHMGTGQDVRSIALPGPFQVRTDDAIHVADTHQQLGPRQDGQQQERTQRDTLEHDGKEPLLLSLSPRGERGMDHMDQQYPGKHINPPAAEAVIVGNARRDDKPETAHAGAGTPQTGGSRRTPTTPSMAARRVSTVASGAVSRSSRL